MIIYCCTCGKQVVSGQNPSIWDRHTTPIEGAKANFGNMVFCGHCAEDLDEYGLFPEERNSLTKEERWLMYPNEN
jgi:hypothetical protein